MANTQFYKKLPVHPYQLHEVMRESSYFTSVPPDWEIIVTDVEGSTKQVEAGNQQLVNLAATASIIACLNIARRETIEIPFFFGGDGATILIPPQILEECLFALKLHQERCKINFDFYLRVDHRSVDSTYEMGGRLSIARVKINDLYILPVVLGDGLLIAEADIKSKDRQLEQDDSKVFNLDLSGMECKWNAVHPPQDDLDIISLIIQVKDLDKQSEIYGNVLHKLDELIGKPTDRHPVNVSKLSLSASLKRIKQEVKAKFNKSKGKEVVASLMRSYFGKWYLNYTKSGKKYLKELVLLTETLTIDGSINTVISANKVGKKKLLEYLENEEQHGRLIYGHYTSPSSVLSCYVTALDDYHIHFLDGSNGGYTQAARMLKAKF